MGKTARAEAVAASPATGRPLYFDGSGWTSRPPSPDPTPPPGRRSRLKGTPQQEAFWAELREGDSHVLLEARAGTGKSTSCREGMWRLLEADPRRLIRYCCFNKAIADEFAAKCPPGVEVGTMHRFGLQALQAAFGSKLEADKTYAILDDLGMKDAKRYVRRSVARLVSLAKNHGLRPGAPGLPLDLDALADRYEVDTWRQAGAICDAAARALARSAEMTAVVDFDDMLWLPTLHGVRFPDVDFLFIDECQDLNPAQHGLAAGLSGSGRTVVVGDPYQSIYAFRGADCDSIPRLREALEAKVMPLTVTFRCPRSHVELARELVPDFEAAPEAPEGVLEHRGPDAIDEARPGDLVLCRANAPVISACLRQIALLVPAHVRGRAVGDSLLAIARKLGDPATIADFGRELARWKGRELARLESKDDADDLVEQVQDRAAGLEAIASACSSPAEIPAAIQRLFSEEDDGRRVTFGSVHRAKGSEARRVAYIQIPYSERRDRARPPRPAEHRQRRNLRYVALTRSLETLTLIS